MECLQVQRSMSDRLIEIKHALRRSSSIESPTLQIAAIIDVVCTQLLVTRAIITNIIKCFVTTSVLNTLNILWSSFHIRKPPCNFSEKLIDRFQSVTDSNYNLLHTFSKKISSSIDVVVCCSSWVYLYLVILKWLIELDKNLLQRTEIDCILENMGWVGLHMYTYIYHRKNCFYVVKEG